MAHFYETTHLSEILEKSNEQPVVVFKYSLECISSSRLKKELVEKIEQNKITNPIYLVTVQTHRVLSEKIEEYFQTKHESPQIIVLNKNKITYTAHHNDIDINKLV